MVITLTIPDAVAPRVVDALALSAGWTPQNPKGKNAFAKDQLISHLKGLVRQYESESAVQAARTAVNNSVESEIGIT